MVRIIRVRRSPWCAASLAWVALLFSYDYANAAIAEREDSAPCKRGWSQRKTRDYWDELKTLVHQTPDWKSKFDARSIVVIESVITAVDRTNRTELLRSLADALEPARNDEVRLRAMYTLTNMDGEADVATCLEKAAQDANTDIRDFAIGGLGHFPYPTGIDSLMCCLERKDERNISECLRSMEEIGIDAKDSPRIATFLAPTFGRFDRIRAARVLATLGSEAGNYVPKILVLFDGEDIDDWEVLCALVDIGTKSPDVLAAYKKALGAKREEARRWGLVGLRCAGPGGPDVLQLVSHVAKHDVDKWVREEAAYTLAAIGGPAAPLIELLVDPDSGNRSNAVADCGKLGSRGAATIPALILATKDLEAEVRAKAVESLGRIKIASPEVIQAICGGLRDEQSEVRAAAAASLALFPKDALASVQILRRIRESFEERPRLAAAIALWRIEGDREGMIPILQDTLLNHRKSYQIDDRYSEYPSILAVFHVMGEMGRDGRLLARDAAPYLRFDSGQHGAKLVVDAVEAIATTGDTTVNSEIRCLLKSRFASVRNAAVRALAVKKMPEGR